MGEGTFGQVLECWDRERKEMVAIKIIRSIKKYREAAMIEVDVLQQLVKHDKNASRVHLGLERMLPNLRGYQNLVPSRLLILVAQRMAQRTIATLYRRGIIEHLRLY
ncbi:serine/threonine-protein kinase AFC2 isoform X1 [Iris pallida]|uniref:Serine/threonine-protein kinase AFC2 isoform X1 n=1 Tax=Iris pallida TaxID=29817 RepID=A0AAX6EZL6_IRIPA|nr:serine/threonine-protein kinase AFC2 isoform X1 [Iris pallida]